MACSKCRKKPDAKTVEQKRQKAQVSAERRQREYERRQALQGKRR